MFFFNYIIGFASVQQQQQQQQRCTNSNNKASLTGSIAGARSDRGNNRPTACITVKSGVFGAKVKTIEPVHLDVKDAKAVMISSRG